MGTLFDAERSVLVVIDTQPYFLSKVEPGWASLVAGRVAWLVDVAGRFDVPVVVTEEEPDRNGATHPMVAAALPSGTVAHTKPTFGLAFTASILEAVTGTGRDQAVLCGLETDVCVAQSAIGLKDLGWKVGVVVDAVASPGTSHAQGLDRMGQAGVELVGLKGLYYEWLRRVDRLCDPWRPPTPPPGITL